MSSLQTKIALPRRVTADEAVRMVRPADHVFVGIERRDAVRQGVARHVPMPITRVSERMRNGRVSRIRLQRLEQAKAGDGDIAAERDEDAVIVTAIF